MAGDAVGGESRYWAFISYSHKDAAFGRWLHRRLENYSLPRRLVGRTTGQGAVPRRLVPIFRDREEFPAATDLSTEVRAALAQSRSLVVVCSPDAAASPWVSREVELFRSLHPGKPILAAIRAGEPAQSFPRTLFTIGPSGEPVEPLAADFRMGRDGRQLGILKLVAGVAGLGLDELVQRDAQKHRQRVMAVTAVALAAVSVMAVLTTVALLSRREAEQQRGEAEGLVEFMLTDLRDRLKGVGRLDVMTAVNQRALHYYEDQKLASLPVDSLERRARILNAMGEDDDERGDHASALLKFREAERTTAELLRDSPNEPERVFDHAQSVYWIGWEDYQNGQLAPAKKQFLTYKMLAVRMIALDPAKVKYRLELDYAESNLCSLALHRPFDRKGALQHCGAALAAIESVAQIPHRNDKSVPSRKVLDDLTENCLANMADAYLLDNNTRAARAARNSEQKLLENEMASDPKNKDLDDVWIILQRSLAVIDERDGNWMSARRRLENALGMATQMMKYDPRNRDWAQLRDRVAGDLLAIQHR